MLSAAPAEPDNMAAIALRRTSLGQLFELPHGLVLCCNLRTSLFAGVSFAVESPGDRRWPPDLTEQQDFHFKLTAGTRDAQYVTDVDFARGLGELPFGLNP